MNKGKGNSNSERRRFQRVRVNITVNYQVNKPSRVRVLVGDDETEAQALDISEGGMAILTDYDIPVSTVLSIEFMLRKVDDKNNFTFYEDIKAVGQVRSNVLLEKDKHRLGICFTQIEDETKTEIADFIRMGIDSPKA